MSGKSEVPNRMQVYFPPEVKADLVNLSKELGLSQSQLVILLVKLGKNAFLRAYQPEKMLTASDWAKLIEATKEKEEKSG